MQFLLLPWGAGVRGVHPAAARRGHRSVPGGGQPRVHSQATSRAPKTLAAILVSVFGVTASPRTLNPTLGFTVFRVLDLGAQTLHPKP